MGFTVVSVTVQGGADGSLVIDPPVLARHQRIEMSTSDAIYGPEGLGGNGIHSRRFLVHLSGDKVGSIEYLEDPFDRPVSFTLAAGESQRILFIAIAGDDKRHLWWLELPIIYAGRRQVLSIQNAGQPFVTYGGHGLRQFMLVGGQWQAAPGRYGTWRGA